MGEWIQRFVAALERGRQFATHDVWRIGKPGEEIPSGFITKQIRVAILLVTNLLEGWLMLRASALTFATVLSIVPLFAVMFFSIRTLGLDEAIFESVRTRVDHTLTDGIFAGRDETSPEDADAPDAVVEPASAAPAEPAAAPGSEGHESFDALQDQFRQLVFGDVAQSPGGGAVDPVGFLFDIAERVSEEASARPQAYVVAGAILFLTTIVGLLRNIEGAFNHIWGVRRTRPWYRMVSDYLLILVLLPFVAAALLGITAALQSERVHASLGPFSIAVRIGQAGVIWLVFAALYSAVPNTRVRFRYALLGGVVAGTAWMLLSWGYVKFQVGVTTWNPVFSTFAQFPVLLMWIYLSWTILLFGAELAFAYQNETTFAMERFAERASFAYRETLGLRAMLEMARRFDSGEGGLEPEAASRDLNVPSRLLTDTLEQLEEAGLAAKCATSPQTFQPARSLEKIAVADVLRALREHGEAPSQLRDDEAYNALLEPLLAPPSPARATFAELVRQLPGGERGAAESIAFPGKNAKGEAR